MTSSRLPHPGRALLRLRTIACSLLLAAAGCAVPALPAQAQSCWINGALGIDFGTVTPAGKEATGTLDFTCQNTTAQTLNFRFCLFMQPGNWSNGQVAPRYMHSYWPVADMAYDLYADPGRTLLLAPPDSGHPVESWTASVPANSTAPVSVRVYGRVHAGQNLPAADYQEQGVNGLLRYRYATSGAPEPSGDCLGGGVGGGTTTTSSSGILARYENACFVSTASDLDFGGVGTLAGARDQTSTIQLQCPANTQWRVGLDDGLHAQGTTRRMRSAGGQHLTYELYRDAGRSLRWGRTQGSDTSDGVGSGGVQTLTVHGRVPAQPVEAAGTYRDTVTILLTY